MASRRRIAGMASLLFGMASAAFAQAANSYPTKVDIGLVYSAERSLQTFTAQSFWKQGGSVTVGGDLWRGFGPAVDLSLTHADSIGNSRVGITTTTITAGPRYRWHPERKISPYGQALFGMTHGSGSIFPSTSGAKTTANSFAIVAGGGVDYRLGRTFDIRVLDVAWVHSALPNGADNKQNNVRIGAGVAVHFGR